MVLTSACGVDRNCNHFSNELVMHLVGRPIPSHINRIARAGNVFSAPINLMPKRMQRLSVSSHSSRSSRSSNPQRRVGFRPVDPPEGSDDESDMQARRL